jgi:hypothetical protein
VSQNCERKRAVARLSLSTQPISGYPQAHDNRETKPVLIPRGVYSMKANRQNLVWDGVVYQAVITCPVCKTQETVGMPPESPLRVYHCPVCLTWLSPKKNDHCIFESYGSKPCAQLQIKERRQQGLPI